MSDETQTGERIAKVMARAGVASRRDAERLILEGRVSVNGVVVTSPALDVGPNDRVTLDGKPIDAPQPARLWLYYKPLGLVTSEKDEKGRQTVFESLPDGMPRVMSVGRLDLNSEGLLLLTNDGELKRRLELPSTGWLRKYRVRVNGRPNEATFDPLRRGITIEGEEFLPMDISLDRQQGANAWLTVGLREGRNREIRRAMTEVGLTVNRLIRVSYGPFRLNEMKPGDVVEVKQKVLRDQLGEGAQSDDRDRPRRAPAAGGRRSADGPRTGRDEARGGERRPERRPRDEGGAREQGSRFKPAEGREDRPRRPRATSGDERDKGPGGKGPRRSTEGHDGGRGERSGRPPREGGSGDGPRGPRRDGQGGPARPRRDEAGGTDRPARWSRDGDGAKPARKPRATADRGDGAEGRARPPRSDDRAGGRPPRHGDDTVEARRGGFGKRPAGSNDASKGDRAPRGGKSFDGGDRPRSAGGATGAKPWAKSGPRADRDGAARGDGPRKDGPRKGGFGQGGSRGDGPRQDRPRRDGPNTGGSKTGGRSTGGPNTGGSKIGSPKTGGPKTGGSKTGGPRSSGPRPQGGSRDGSSPARPGRGPRKGPGGK